MPVVPVLSASLSRVLSVPWPCGLKSYESSKPYGLPKAIYFNHTATTENE